MSKIALVLYISNYSFIYDLNNYEWIEYDRKDKENEEKLMEKYHINDTISMDTMYVAINRLKRKIGEDQVPSNYASKLYIVPIN